MKLKMKVEMVKKKKIIKILFVFLSCIVSSKQKTCPNYKGLILFFLLAVLVRYPLTCYRMLRLRVLDVKHTV